MHLALRAHRLPFSPQLSRVLERLNFEEVLQRLVHQIGLLLPHRVDFMAYRSLLHRIKLHPAARRGQIVVFRALINRS